MWDYQCWNESDAVFYFFIFIAGFGNVRLTVIRADVADGKTLQRVFIIFKLFWIGILKCATKHGVRNIFEILSNNIQICASWYADKK